MNEIHQLKTEHARYKKTLETLQSGRITTIADTRRVVECALNPPPLPPVTLADLQDALRKAQDKTGDYVALLLNEDGSGNFRLGPSERRGADFNNLQEALDMLLSGDI